MTRLDLSPETLDALAAVRSANEAAAPRVDYNPMPPKPADLQGLIALIRAEYLAEVPVRLHVAYVPGALAPIYVAVDSEDTVSVEDTGALGSPSWSPTFHRLIGAVKWDDDKGMLNLRDSDLRPFPWRRNLEGVRRWCSGKHRTWYEHQERPLCWTLAQLVIFGGYSIGRAGQLQGIPPEKAETLVTTALGKLYAWVSNDLNGIDLRPARPAA